MTRPWSFKGVLGAPATAGLCGAAILVSVLDLAGEDVSVLALDGSTFVSEPWRLWTSALPHVGPIHLLFNVWWTSVFGLRLEQRYGSWRTIALYALIAPVSAAAEYALFRGGVGLSGVGYGLFGLLWVVSRRDPALSDAMDARTVRLFVGWFFLCIAMTVLDLLAVANVAHGVGALIGALVGWAIVGPRSLGIAGAVALTVASIAGAWIGRPYVNLSGAPARELAITADRALDEGDLSRAITTYEQSLALEPDDARVQYNLGVALQRSERDVDALARYERAHALEPTDMQYRDAVTHLSAYLALVALSEGHASDAVRYLERAAELAPDDASIQRDLALARDAAGSSP